MANVQKGMALANVTTDKKAKAAPSALSVLLQEAGTKKRFEQMLHDKAPAFLSSVLTVVRNNALLSKADPRSILQCAGIAAALDMPILPALGKAYLVPFQNKKAGTVECQFIIGYAGLIQLAQRSGQMKYITAFPVYEGEIESWDKFTETVVRGEKKSDKVIGYYAAFELINGFVKKSYVTKEEAVEHAKKYSKSYNSSTSVYNTEPDAMFTKNVLAHILKKYAPLSVEMQKALVADDSDKTYTADADDNSAFIEAEVVPEDVSVDTVAEVAEPDVKPEVNTEEQEILEAMNK